MFGFHKKKQYDIEPLEYTGSYITLGQAMKLQGLVESGVMAKEVIQNGEVTVNGENETRRGRKLQDGDVVCYAGESFVARQIIGEREEE